MSRLGLALVFLLFGLPLFVGLRSVDLENDEAIYSFAVDRILEIGDWLQPKYSPDETGIFLEKPPLKFWIVAAPIKAGLLPHDEFGLRFWDALAGSVAFLYLFAVGSRLAGPVCGLVAVLLLFVHGPLLFEHGLRTNNMEGMLFLSYCGGVFHFLRWAGGRGRHPHRDATATALYFALGFMTKFVAAIFLPAVLGGAALLVADGRRRLWRDRAMWTLASLLAVALIAPWFIYASVVFGTTLWETMLGQHVYARFTTSLNPQHIEPRWFYFTSMFGWFSRAGAFWLVTVGSAVLVVQSVRRRWIDGLVVCLWGACLLAISLGSSKLYHYAYPFLPPFALAGGYVTGLVATLGPQLLKRAAGAVEDTLARAVPSVARLATRGTLVAAGMTVVTLLLVLAAATLATGALRLEWDRTVLLRNSSLVRPIALAAVIALLLRRSARVAAPVVLLTLASWLPVAMYRETWPELTRQRHPLRDVRDCILRVQSGAGRDASIGQGLYYDGDGAIWHPIYYYLRRVRPWVNSGEPDAVRLDRTLRQPPLTPSLVQETRYRAYLAGPQQARFTGPITPPRLELLEQELLLPGPYGVCSSEARLIAHP